MMFDICHQTGALLAYFCLVKSIFSHATKGTAGLPTIFLSQCYQCRTTDDVRNLYAEIQQ